MQIGGIKNQSLIPNKNEVKKDKKPSDSDNVSLGGSGTKMDDILNYKNLAAQNACNCKEGFLETYKTPIQTGAGALAGAGIALLAGADPKAATAVALLGAGAGFIGAKSDLTPGIAIGAAAGTAITILGGATVGGVVGAAALGGFIGGFANMISYM